MVSDCGTRSLRPFRSSGAAIGRRELVRCRTPFAPAQCDEIFARERLAERVAHRAIEHRMGMRCIAEQERDVEYAGLRYDAWQCDAGDEGEVYGADLHAFHHFDLAAEDGIRMLLNADASPGALRHFL